MGPMSRRRSNRDLGYLESLDPFVWCQRGHPPSPRRDYPPRKRASFPKCCPCFASKYLICDCSGSTRRKNKKRMPHCPFREPRQGGGGVYRVQLVVTSKKPSKTQVFCLFVIFTIRTETPTIRLFIMFLFILVYFL